MIKVDVVIENNGKLDLTEIKAGATFHDEMSGNLKLIRNLLPNEVGMSQVVYAGRDAFGSEGIRFQPFTFA